MKILQKISNKITHIPAMVVCVITMLVILVMGVLSPFLPVFTRETLAYVSGWLVEGTLIILLYFIIKDWIIFKPLTKYFLFIGHLLLIIMYGLWLCIDFGHNYPNISAIGFNVSTIFRTIAIFTLIYTIFNRYYRRR